MHFKLTIRINAYQYGSLLRLKGILGEKKFQNDLFDRKKNFRLNLIFKHDLI